MLGEDKSRNHLKDKPPVCKIFHLLHNTLAFPTPYKMRASLNLVPTAGTTKQENQK